ncbi:MAG: AAA family ATPase [Muribaculaceae bacterium]|nr:AAA family ATPase [Muribaculaceae bacterium]
MENNKHLLIDIQESQLDFSDDSWKQVVKRDFQEIRNALEKKPNNGSPAYYTWFLFFLKYGNAICSEEGKRYIKEHNTSVFNLVRDTVGLEMTSGGAYTVGYKFYDECIKNAKAIHAAGILIQIQKKSKFNILQSYNSYIKYITAIRTKPFVLLAGISGTGKSRIVRQLARACWEPGSDEARAHKPSNFEMVQVKPNWHDSSELIGYVSRIGDKPEFVAGDFLKFIAKAWANPEMPHFLCLDEMNLAPVEQYFAEYLSVVESRKLQSDGKTITTDPLLKVEAEQWYIDLCHKLSPDNDDVREQFLKDGIAIPQNLIVVGTVNMDETTYSFSRKVLDRAMTIEMNEVDLNGGLHKAETEMPHIPADHFLADAVEGYDVYEQYEEAGDKVIGYLGKVNTKLDGSPFKVAYRTRNEFLIYVVNALKLANAEGADAGVIAKALDEVTSMKILSRIEGDRRKVGNILADLKQTVKDGLDEIAPGYSERPVKDLVSLPKLRSMTDRLASGYTSFWD